MIRQKNELTNAIDNITKQNRMLSDTLEVTQRNLYESNRDCDNLNINLSVTEDKINKLKIDIADQDVLNNTIKETKDDELKDLKLFLDNTILKQDTIFKERELEQQQALNE